MTETEKYQLTAMKNAILAEKNAPKSAPMTYNNKGQSVQPPVTPVQKQMYEARNESRRLDIHEKEAEAQRIKGLQAQYDEKMKTINKTDPHFGIESQDVSKSTVGAGAGACLVYKKFGTKTVAVVGLLGVAALGTYKLHEDVNKITGHNDIKVEKTEKIDGNSVEVEGTRQLDNLTPEEINNLTPEELRDALPDGWEYTQSPNGDYVHVRDGNGNYRVRIDPADKVTDYPHTHVYDGDGNALDLNGDIVPANSPDAHIPR